MRQTPYFSLAVDVAQAYRADLFARGIKATARPAPEPEVEAVEAISYECLYCGQSFLRPRDVPYCSPECVSSADREASGEEGDR